MLLEPWTVESDDPLTCLGARRSVMFELLRPLSTVRARAGAFYFSGLYTTRAMVSYRLIALKSDAESGRLVEKIAV
jgi:hypothetical protein